MAQKHAEWGADSTLGKAMEKVGHMVKSENLVERGHAKRVGAGLGKEEEKAVEDLEGKYVAN